jgi:hypothetical protein
MEHCADSFDAIVLALEEDEDLELYHELMPLYFPRNRAGKCVIVCVCVCVVLTVQAPFRRTGGVTALTCRGIAVTYLACACNRT